MKYFKVCVTCGKDYEINADPKTEQDWKNIQSQVGKRGGLCANCTNTSYYDDGCMDLKNIAEKHNAIITIVQGGMIEIQCPAENLADIAQDILYDKPGVRDRRQIAKIRAYTFIYGSKAQFVKASSTYLPSVNDTDTIKGDDRDFSISGWVTKK